MNIYVCMYVCVYTTCFYVPMTMYVHYLLVMVLVALVSISSFPPAVAIHRPNKVKYSRVIVWTQLEGLNAHLATKGAHCEPLEVVAALTIISNSRLSSLNNNFFLSFNRKARPVSSLDMAKNMAHAVSR